MIPVPEVNLGGVLPALIIGVAGLLATLLGLFVRKGAATVGAIIGLAGVLIALAVNAPLRSMDTLAFSGMVSIDPLSWFFNMAILLSVGLTILISMKYLTEQDLDLYEYFAILLFSAVGMMFMVSGAHLLMIFVGLETLSIGVYVLTGVLPKNPKASEASLKYLLVGAFSSGFFLYGAAFLYGASGSLSLAALAEYFKSGSVNTMGMVGMGMLLIGFSFKVAAVPFHMWTPDVYDGAPAPITGFMSVGVKAAAFAAFLRVFFESFGAVQVSWSHILWILAALTMILGNVAALAQSNIKRMLAYSSIAHAGYILIGMVAGTSKGAAGILYYMLAYIFTNLGAFAVVTMVGRKGEANVDIDDYRGLGKSHPTLALAMSIFLFSLAGIPPTAGFIGKFTIFGAAIDAGYIWLVIIGVLTSAASVFYYFRVVMKMYMEAPEVEPESLKFSPSMSLAVTLTVLVVLYIGIFPTTYLNLATESVKTLF